jgi:hypothetical protein
MSESMSFLNYTQKKRIYPYLAKEYVLKEYYLIGTLILDGI